MLAEFITDLNSQKAEEKQNIAVFEKWLPGTDSNCRPSD